MDRSDLPLGFTFALAMNPDAMQNFSQLSESEKDDVVRKARSVSSKAEMNALVNVLSEPR